MVYRQQDIWCTLILVRIYPELLISCKPQIASQATTEIEHTIDGVLVGFHKIRYIENMKHLMGYEKGMYCFHNLRATSSLICKISANKVTHTTNKASEWYKTRLINEINLTLRWSIILWPPSARHADFIFRVAPKDRGPINRSGSILWDEEAQTITGAASLILCQVKQLVKHHHSLWRLLH